MSWSQTYQFQENCDDLAKVKSTDFRKQWHHKRQKSHSDKHKEWAGGRWSIVIYEILILK